MDNIYHGLDAWHSQVREDVVDPARRIVDPHHHIHQREGRHYSFADFRADIAASGHKVETLVFTQCRYRYRTDGPEEMQPVGETEAVARIAVESREDGLPRIAAIVGHADLTRGDAVDVLDAHEAAGQGLFRGIRQVAAHDPHPELSWIGAQVAPGLYRDPAFVDGVRRLGQRGFSLDAWHFHHQMQDFIAVVRAVPETVFVLDHFSTILGVGPYVARRAEVLAQWRKDMVDLAALPNVVMKLGGMTMPSNGYEWEKRQVPVTSDEFIAAQGDIYRHAIDCFGPERCMFESNFPVDKIAVSYRVLWNAFKKMTASFSKHQKDALFRGTASRVYRLGE